MPEQRRIKIKNWSRFQHYKHRCPPWIKLATDTFQNPDFARLQDASKLLAICIWTLAAKSQDGSVVGDFDYIHRWGFLGPSVTTKNLQELESVGFIDYCLQDASKLHTNADSETETEAEAETEKNPLIPLFREPDPSAPAKPKRQPRKRAAATTFPEGFEPKQSHIELAAKLGVDLAVEFRRFRDRAVAKGETYANWDSALSYWVRNQHKFNGASRSFAAHA